MDNQDLERDLEATNLARSLLIGGLIVMFIFFLILEFRLLDKEDLTVTMLLKEVIKEILPDIISIMIVTLFLLFLVLITRGVDIRKYLFPYTFNLEIEVKKILDNQKNLQQVLTENMELCRSNKESLVELSNNKKDQTKDIEEIHKLIEMQKNINTNIEENVNLSCENHEKINQDLELLLKNEINQTTNINILKELTEQYRVFFQYEFLEPNKVDTTKEIFNHYLSLKNNTLHYVAFHNKYGNIEEYGHPKLSRYIEEFEERETRNTEQKQLQEYNAFASDYDTVIGEVENRLEKLKQGKLIKIAFDVKIGGIFYYLYPDSHDNRNENQKLEYIFGATLDQKRMDDASAYKQMQEIFESIDNHIRNKFK